MTRRVDVRPSFVDLTVNDEPSRVDRHLAAIDAVAIFINSNEIRHLDHAKVDRVWIDPESLWLDWITQGNMARAAIAESEFCEHAKCASHVL